VKPFFNFNVTECKLIMKEVFINEWWYNRFRKCKTSRTWNK
jgi:hypothetical protein